MAVSDGWFRPEPRSRGLATRSALVIMAEQHATVATTLILQEMGYSVDVGAAPDSALAWLSQARYEVIMLGPTVADDLVYLTSIHHAAPTSRVITLSTTALGDDLRSGERVPPNVEVLTPPFDVNALIHALVEPGH